MREDYCWTRQSNIITGVAPTMRHAHQHYRSLVRQLHAQAATILKRDESYTPIVGPRLDDLRRHELAIYDAPQVFAAGLIFIDK